MTTEKIKNGDVVRLNSESRVNLTVMSIDNDWASCMYYKKEEEEFQRVSIHVSGLKLIKGSVEVK